MAMVDMVMDPMVLAFVSLLLVMRVMLETSLIAAVVDQVAHRVGTEPLVVLEDGKEDRVSLDQIVEDLVDVQSLAEESHSMVR